MKNKKMVFGTMLLLFAISGICNIISVSAEEFELPPLSYRVYTFYDVNNQDELEIYVSSSGTVNVYVMDEHQLDVLDVSGGLIWMYLKRWKDITHLEYTYTIPYDDEYYVVIYNKNVLFGRTVEVDIEVIPYFDITPVVILIILIGVITGLLVSIVLVKRSKREKREVGTQVQEVIKPKSFYCSNCGAENIDITSDYCSKCGSKIIK